MSKFQDPSYQPDEFDKLFEALTTPPSSDSIEQFEAAHDLRCAKLSNRKAKTPENDLEIDFAKDLYASIMVFANTVKANPRSEGELALPIQPMLELEKVQVWQDEQGERYCSALVELQDVTGQQAIQFNGMAYALGEGIVRAHVVLKPDGKLHYETLFGEQALEQELAWLARNSDVSLAQRYQFSPIMKQVLVNTGSMLLDHVAEEKTEFTKAINSLEPSPNVFSVETHKHQFQTTVSNRPVDLGLDFVVRYDGPK